MSRGQSWPLDLWCQWAGARLSACGGSSLILCVLLQRAFNALCHSTHLYGRRLVLEWADSEVTLQALRRKTAEHFHGKSDGTCKEHVPLWADCRARRGAPPLSLHIGSRPPSLSLRQGADPRGWHQGLHDLSVSQSNWVIGRPGKKLGRGGGAWGHSGNPHPHLLSCLLGDTATKGHSSNPVALSTQHSLSRAL